MRKGKLAFAGFLLVSIVAAQAQRPLDLLLRGGQVVDGSGAAGVVTDVGIRGDRIAFIGDAAKAGIRAARTIDVKGLIVSPGFIDPHAHVSEDLSNPSRSGNEPYLMQGVTTVITGNDGGGPVQSGALLARWTGNGLGTNAAVYVGQGAIRREVMAMSDAQPDPEQMTRMRAMVERAMREGAIGMSTGLYYAPGSYARTEEVIELAKVAARLGGVYDSHMRDESSYSIGLLNSIRETIRIGKEAAIPVHIAHIKALGPEVWGQSTAAIELIRQERAAGVKITADQYPYAASGSSVTASLVPRWAEVGGGAALLKRIDDPEVRPRLVAEMEANLKRRGGPESLLLITPRDRTLLGKTLAAVASETKRTPVEAAIEIIKSGGSGVASFNMNEKDIENFMKQDFVMTGSDGSGGHPRKYGTFARKLGVYVRERKTITLPFAIHASSALAAETFQFKDRGLLRDGYYADVIAFDPATVADLATYEQPAILATGVKLVIVNGKIAVEEGKPTGVKAGAVIRSAASEK